MRGSHFELIKFLRKKLANLHIFANANLKRSFFSWLVF